MPPPDRLAAAVSAIAGRVTEPEARAQLHALAALLNGYEPASASPEERARLEQAVQQAIDRDDEPAAIEAMRELAAIERSAVRGVNWSAASGG